MNLLIQLLNPTKPTCLVGYKAKDPHFYEGHKNLITQHYLIQRNQSAWWDTKAKGHRFHDDLLNLFLDGKKKKLTDIGFGFLGFYWNRFFGLILDRLI